MLDTDNEIYRDSYSLNTLKQDVAEELDSANPKYREWQNNLWSRLDELFKLIDRGSRSRGIPEDDLYIPAYNGGLFRTDPDEFDSPEARFLATHPVGDSYLAKVIELLTRSNNGNGGGKIFVDYSSLDIRHLGSVYEGLLEYQLNVADEPLVLDDGEYISANGEGGTDGGVVVGEGEVYLTTDSGERKATGSYYTPEYVVEYIVENTLGPLVEEIRKDLVARSARDEGGFAEEFAEEVFQLKVLDPAMGSGHFLTSAVDYLAREIIDAQERQAAQQGIETVNEEHDINWARRQVAQRCIYGVDLNPLAVELSKVSLWLRTLAAEQPLAFLDHHLKTGNSLLGSDIDYVLENGDQNSDTTDQQLTLHHSFNLTRRKALEHVTDRFQDLLAIDNETLDDVKEMEAVFEEVRDDPLYQHLLAMANVHTADAFGVDVPPEAYGQMAAALRDNSWGEIESQDWFASAEVMANEQGFFHWELEFPIAFYDDDGTRLDDAGFDAVIGNPPYVSNWELTSQQEDLPSILEALYPEPTSGHWDLFVPFCYKGMKLTRNRGRHSFITPTSLGSEKYGRDLREIMISDYNIEKIVSFGNFQVFPGVDRQCMIYILQPGTIRIPTQIVSWTGLEFQEDFSIDQDRFLEFSYNSIRPTITQEELTIKFKIEAQSIELGHLCCVNPGVVAHSGSDSPRDFDKDDVIYSHDGDGFKKYIEGKDIDRYVAKWDNLYMDYENNREHFHRPKFPDLFESEKIMFRGVSGSNARIISYPDSNGFYTNHNILHAALWEDEILERQSSMDYSIFDQVGDYNIRYISAIVNSSLLSFYFKSFLGTGTLQGSYSGMYPEDIRSLPIKKIDSIESEARRLTNLVNKLVERKDKRMNIDLNLKNYLGNYKEGPRLANVGHFQPSEIGILNATTDDYEKLRVGEVSVERNGGSVTVFATARHKPEDRDAFETDQWGYAETDYNEVFTLKELSEKEAALIKAFVPLAVGEGDGFAGFRDNATKTNSPVDRLKSIILPDTDDVHDDLHRYIEASERAGELDELIEDFDRQIDDLVYDIFGLSDREIEIVEESVSEEEEVT